MNLEYWRLAELNLFPEPSLTTILNEHARGVQQVLFVAGSVLKRDAFVAYQVQGIPRQKDVSVVNILVDRPGSGEATPSLCPSTARRRL